MLKNLRKNFITGFAVILPTILTIWLVKFIIDKANMILLEPIVGLLKPYIFDSRVLEFAAKTLIFVSIVLSVALIGFATRLILLRKLFSYLERKFSHFPMIGKIYGAFKEISHALLGQTEGIIKRAVLVEYPRKGIYAVGFVTSEGKETIHDGTGKKLISVLIGTTPTPTSGFLILVPEDEIIPLDISIEEALKLIISGGIIPLPEGVTIKKKDGDTDN